MLSFDSWAQGHGKNRRSNGLVDRMSTAARIILLHQPALLRLALLTWSESQVVLLLCGGDNRMQDADTSRACEYWRDWQGRT